MQILVDIFIFVCRCWNSTQFEYTYYIHVEASEIWQPVFRFLNAADHKAVFLWPPEAAFVRPQVSNNGFIVMELFGFLKGHYFQM